MTRVHSILASGLALLAALLAPGAHAADDQALPWDGRFQDLTVDSLTDKRAGRPPSTTTGVATLAVDSQAIFGGQTNFRRSELVQDVAGDTAGTTFFRVSLMKEAAYVNLYSWQVVFPESHLFEIRIDASVDPVQLVWYTGGSTETRWSTEFKTETWYNFGIAVSSGELALYFSEGDDAIALTKTETYDGAVPTDYEFHFGQLTLSNDGSAVKMVDGQQDVLSFNGVSVESDIPSGLGSSTGSSTATSAPAAAPSATTATPTATTATSSTEAATTSEATDDTTDASASTSTDEDTITATDAPTTDAPATDAPATDAPATEAPATDAPATDAPATDAPTTGTSGCKVRRRD
ncbi:hypothetical protein PF004_g8338 [Phytophthora fragariae]|uniref:Glycoside hydrolase 131 catalytic N-terminal domain-containing protein n=1 Tax=Phytophthora fragariae TaxID=53985 RepID=A0A6G0P6Y2_9STRA|nr:hypothetical protein PF004_g8338 [Phytophthora fragariae]